MTKQNTLLIDIGNSSVKWGHIEHGNAINVSTMSQQYYPEKVSAAFFIEYWKTLDKPENIMVSCVAKQQVWQALEQACDQLWALQPKRITSAKEGFGLVSTYKQPADLGSDRWCAMIGAFHETTSDFVMVSCGSAMTLDVVTSSGKHSGGYILPGLAMMKKSLASDTAGVKVILEQAKPSLLPANSTAGCVDSAINLAAVKLIEAVYQQQNKSAESMPCFLTGGDAPFIAELLSIKCVMMPDLVLRGLAIISSTQQK